MGIVNDMAQEYGVCITFLLEIEEAADVLPAEKKMELVTDLPIPI